MAVARWNSRTRRPPRSRRSPPTASARSTASASAASSCASRRCARSRRRTSPRTCSSTSSARRTPVRRGLSAVRARARERGWRVLLHAGVRAGHYDRGSGTTAPQRWEDRRRNRPPAHDRAARRPHAARRVRRQRPARARTAGAVSGRRCSSPARRRRSDQYWPSTTPMRLTRRPMLREKAFILPIDVRRSSNVVAIRLQAAQLLFAIRVRCRACAARPWRRSQARRGRRREEPRAARRSAHLLRANAASTSGQRRSTSAASASRHERSSATIARTTADRARVSRRAASSSAPSRRVAR